MTMNEERDNKAREMANKMCREFGLRRYESIEEYSRKHDKHFFRVDSIASPNREKRTRMEICHHRHRSSLANLKLMSGKGLLSHKFIRPFHKHTGYVYETRGTLRTYIDNMSLDTERDREIVITPLLRNIVFGLNRMHILGFYNSTMSWDVFEVRWIENEATVGAMEHFIPEKKALNSELAAIKHLPPEVLKREGNRRVNPEKQISWILGSQLLEYLLGKRISGPGFQLDDGTVRRRQARLNIESNVSTLADHLSSSELSEGMQALIHAMLALNPVYRPSLNSILNAMEEMIANEARTSESIDNTELDVDLPYNEDNTGSAVVTNL